MKVVIDEKLVKRNARIGQILTIASLGTLAAGMLITFRRPDILFLSIVALMGGFLLSQIGLYYTNRWGRSPRPDEQITAALKGMEKRYGLYHYRTPAAHLLVGPAGLWVLVPRYQRGTITYIKNRWRLRGGGFLQNYLKIFGQEGLGRPDLEIASEIDGVKRYLKKALPPDTEIPEIRAALVFSHPEADIQVEETPVPALPAKKLKDFIRSAAKEKSISPAMMRLIQDTIDPAGETDAG